MNKQNPYVFNVDERRKRNALMIVTMKRERERGKISIDAISFEVEGNILHRCLSFDNVSFYSSEVSTSIFFVCRLNSRERKACRNIVS